MLMPIRLIRDAARPFAASRSASDLPAAAALRSVVRPETLSRANGFQSALESWFLASAATLGKRTAELHVTLAGHTSAEELPDAFRPRPLDADEILKQAAALPAALARPAARRRPARARAA